MSAQLTLIPVTVSGRCVESLLVISHCCFQSVLSVVVISRCFSHCYQSLLPVTVMSRCYQSVFSVTVISRGIQSLLSVAVKNGIIVSTERYSQRALT